VGEGEGVRMLVAGTSFVPWAKWEEVLAEEEEDEDGEAEAEAEEGSADAVYL